LLFQTSNLSLPPGFILACQQLYQLPANLSFYRLRPIIPLELFRNNF